MHSTPFPKLMVVIGPKQKSLAPFFSGRSSIQMQVQVEIEYFIALPQLGLPQFRRP